MFPKRWFDHYAEGVTPSKPRVRRPFAAEPWVASSINGANPEGVAPGGAKIDHQPKFGEVRGALIEWNSFRVRHMCLDSPGFRGKGPRNPGLWRWNAFGVARSIAEGRHDEFAL